MPTITLATQRGQITCTTDLTLQQAYAVLVKSNPKDLSSFERDLVSYYERWGDKISAGRSNWLLYLAQTRLDRAAQPAPVQTQLAIDLKPILSLLTGARQHLKRPKIQLATPDGTQVVLSLAGERSRYTGSINASTGAPFGTPGSFHGRIDPDGSTTIKDRSVLALLEALAADPAGVAAAYGRATGSCAFCGAPLTNGASGSAEIGFGPVCAKKWGLPWSPNGRSYEFVEGKAVDLTPTT